MLDWFLQLLTTLPFSSLEEYVFAHLVIDLVQTSSNRLNSSLHVGTVAFTWRPFRVITNDSQGIVEVTDYQIRPCPLYDLFSLDWFLIFHISTRLRPHEAYSTCAASKRNMTNQRCHIIAPVVLLIFAIVGILLLALSTDNVRIPPDYMVNSIYFCNLVTHCNSIWKQK